MGVSSQKSTVVVLLVLSALDIVAVSLRFWARAIQRVPLQLNDFLILPALVFACTNSGFVVYGSIVYPLPGRPHGLGSSDEAQRPPVWPLKALTIGPLIWAVGVFFTRVSIVTLYIHLFRARAFRAVCYVMIAINILFLTAIILTTCLICRPIAYRWNPTIVGGHCGEQKHFDMFVAVFNLLLDVTTVVLPMPILWRLQLALRKKVALSLIFGMGVGICVITAVRIRVTEDISRHADPFDYRLLVLLATLEDSLGVLNACLPTLKPVFDEVFASALWSSASEITSQIANHNSSIRLHMRKKHAPGSRKHSTKIGTASRNWHDDTETLAPAQELQPSFSL